MQNLVVVPNNIVCPHVGDSKNSGDAKACDPWKHATPLLLLLLLLLLRMYWLRWHSHVKDIAVSTPNVVALGQTVWS